MTQLAPCSCGEKEDLRTGPTGRPGAEAVGTESGKGFQRKEEAVRTGRVSGPGSQPGLSNRWREDPELLVLT